MKCPYFKLFVYKISYFWNAFNIPNAKNKIPINLSYHGNEHRQWDDRWKYVHLHKALIYGDKKVWAYFIAVLFIQILWHEYVYE